MFGAAGFDWLYGGLAADTLVGGGGVDHFVFNASMGTGNEDHITDFTVGVDRIVLENNLFSTLLAGPLSASEFTVGAAATTAEHRIVYDSASGWGSLNFGGLLTAYETSAPKS